MLDEIVADLIKVLFLAAAGYGLAILKTWCDGHIKNAAMQRVTQGMFLAAGRVYDVMSKANAPGAGGLTPSEDGAIATQADKVIAKYGPTLDSLAQAGVTIAKQDIIDGIKGHLGNLKGADPTISAGATPLTFIRSSPTLVADAPATTSG